MFHTREPQVRIFFVIGDELFIASSPLSAAVPYGDFRIRPGDHASFWKEIVRAKPSLSSVSYNFYPRGRVLFNAKDETFRVYVDRRTREDRGVVAQILDEFHLPENKTKIRRDSRYNCPICTPHEMSEAIGLEIDDYLP